MSDTQTDTKGTTDAAKADVDKGGTSGYTPPATQDDFNRIINERIQRERAKFSDYSALKEKAAQFDVAAEANKTEAQRLADRVSAAEKAATDAQLDALCYRVAARFGISDEDAALFLTGADEDTLLKQATRFAERTPEPTATGVHVPAEGRTPPNAGLNSDPLLNDIKRTLHIR